MVGKGKENIGWVLTVLGDSKKTLRSRHFFFDTEIHWQPAFFIEFHYLVENIQPL